MIGRVGAALAFLAALCTGPVPAFAGASRSAPVAVATTSRAGTVQLGVDTWKCLRLNSDHGPTGENDTTVADLTWTPDPLADYFVMLQGSFTANAAGTGLYFYVGHGDATDGSVWGQTRGSGATAQALLVGSQSATFVQGASSGATETPFLWTSMLTTDATPTAVGMVYRAETGSGGTVTLQAGRTRLCYWRSVPPA